MKKSAETTQIWKLELKEYYHPYINQNDTETILSCREDGSFLIRPSSKQSMVTVSYRQHGKTMHHRIVREAFPHEIQSLKDVLDEKKGIKTFQHTFLEMAEEIKKRTCVGLYFQISDYLMDLAWGKKEMGSIKDTERIRCFLLGTHPRVGEGSLIRTLPKDAIKYICGYITKPAFLVEGSNDTDIGNGLLMPVLVLPFSPIRIIRLLSIPWRSGDWNLFMMQLKKLPLVEHLELTFFNGYGCDCYIPSAEKDLAQWITTSKHLKKLLFDVRTREGLKSILKSLINNNDIPLESLSLWGDKLLSNTLAALLAKGTLKTLDLRGVVPMAESFFDALSKNTSLKHLLLFSGFKCKDSNSYKHLANALINNTTLEVLHLGQDQPVGADVINALALNTGLKKIDAVPTRDGAQVLLQALQNNTHLEEFYCLDNIKLISDLFNGQLKFDTYGKIDCRKLRNH